MSISFTGVENAAVTFEASGVTAGYPVAMRRNDTVTNAEDGQAPVGVALHQRGDYAGVQIRGFVKVPGSGETPELGWCSLVADGDGGLRLAESKETGKTCLVVSVEDNGKTLGVFL